MSAYYNENDPYAAQRLMAFSVIDFETRSACDIKKSGAWVYSEHPTTEVTFLGYCINDEEPRLWKPGDPFPQDLFDHIAEGCWVPAHQSLMEIAIWNNIMVKQWEWPEIPVNQWYDTMASCARKALPLALDKVSRVMRLNFVKDDVGHKAMLKICKPDKHGRYNEDPELYRITGEYCLDDIRTQRALLHKLRFVEKAEMPIWRLNQRMNLRGLGLDMKFVADCQNVIDQHMPAVKAEFESIVGCKAGSHVKVKEWMNEHIEGAPLHNLQRENVEDALKHRELSDEVRHALELKLLATSTSISKLNSMRNCVGADSRARGLLQYSAATTGRDGGRLLQPHNFPRGVVEGNEDEDGNYVPPWDIVVPAIQSRDLDVIRAMVTKTVDDKLVACDPIEAVSSALRHAIVPAPGKLLLAGDFSTIEARIVLALAGQWDRLDLIKQGIDMYCDFAGLVLGRPINKKDNPFERQKYGKPGVLGCGFQQGAPAFHFKYMRREPFEMAQKCVDTYRKMWAPKVPKLWYGLQEAALRAVWDRVPSSYEGIEYKIEGEWLTCRLRSGRKLYYHNPRQCRRAMPWDPEDIRPAWQYNSMKKGQWQTVDAYGGLQTEHVVSGMARDLLYDRMLVVDAEVMPLVLTVHDEGLGEVDEAEAEDKNKLLGEIMEDLPSWAIELGVPSTKGNVVECWFGDRYRK